MSDIHENVEYANKINELTDAVNELRTEVLRLRDLVNDIAAESPLRLVFAWHIRRRFPALRLPVRRMDVPPVVLAKPFRPMPLRTTTDGRTVSDRRAVPATEFDEREMGA